jgi:hypothetical protein
MTTHPLARRQVDRAQQSIDRWFHGEEPLEAFEAFLAERIDRRYQRHVEDEESRRIRTGQNQFVQFLLNAIDAHPLAVRDGEAASLRRVVWKHAGIVCDDFSRLDIRSGVRFDCPEGGNLAHFNPANITIMTGGKKVFITGLRGTTYLDGTGPIVIYGAFNCASGVNLFTHDHEFQAPDRSLFEQGRTASRTVIYPECFLGEGVFVFGTLNVHDIAAPRTITRLKVAPPPYAIIGGVGSGYGPKRLLDAPAPFPPPFLRETIRNIRAFSEKHGAHLDGYCGVVAEFLQTDRKDWRPFQARIAEAEAALFA